MRLHLPKGLLAALLAACFALPSEAATTVTVGGSTFEFDSLTKGTTLPTASTPALWVTGGRLDVTASNQSSLNNASTVILGNGSYTTTTTDEEGNSSTSASTQVTASQLFLQGNDQPSAIVITSNFVVGRNGSGAAIRFGGDSNYDVEVSGDIQVADDATFGASGTRSVISGSIIGANKTLTLDQINGLGNEVRYNLTGTTGKSINLGGLAVVSGVTVNMNYETATVGDLSVASGASFANDGSLTIAGSYDGGAITNTGTLSFANGATINADRLATITESEISTSGIVAVSGTFTLATGGTVSKGDTLNLLHNGFAYSGALSTETDGSTVASISGGYYKVVAGEEVAYSTASADTSITHIEVIGTLTGVGDSSISTIIPITGSGTVNVSGLLEGDVDALSEFSGTLSLTGTSSTDLSRIHLGNSNTKIANVSKIQLNDYGYLTAWGDKNFNYALEFNGGYLLANGGNWNGNKELKSDSSIQLYNSTTISGSLTAEANTVLSVLRSSDNTADGERILTIDGTVGKLNGATLRVCEGTKVKLVGKNGKNAQIAGSIIVDGGAVLELTELYALGFDLGTDGNYTDRITLQGESGKTASLLVNGRQTFSTALDMKGHATISGNEIMASYNAEITATGTDNIINCNLQVRENLTFAVTGANDTLEISGKLANYSEGSGTITKSGSGTLIVSGDAKTCTRAVTVNDGTLELQTRFNPVKIDLRGTAGTGGTPATYGSLKIAAGGSAQLDTSAANGLWMYENSSLILAKKDGDKSGGALSIGSYITIQADGEDASVCTTATSGNGNYTFGGTDYEFVNANVSITSTGTYKAKLTNVNLINSSTGNATVTVENAANTLRGVDAAGGNIKFDANAKVTGDIKIASGKSVIVNSGAALTHDGFTYDGSTIKTSNAGSALSLWDNADITGGTLTQKENADVGHKEIGATLTNVKLVNTGEHVTWLTAQSDTLSGMEIAGTLRVGQDDTTINPSTQELERTFKKANVTVSGAATVGTLKVDTESTLELAGQDTNSSITTLTGSGTLKTTAGSATVTDASGFTGTLEATGGKLEATITGSPTIAALAADGGDIDVFGVTSLTVKDMVIGDGSTVGVYSGEDASSSEGGLNISGSADAKASLTIGSGATLNTNLSLWNAKLTFQDGALAMGSSLTLILDGSSELYINIGTMKANESLTLFTGVDQFQASANAATIDEASRVFGNLTAGDFKLTYSGADNGGIVALVAKQNVPEPTTATLSLLALMGLAARRRRRKA